jgi:plastocyanin
VRPIAARVALGALLAIALVAGTGCGGSARPAATKHGAVREFVIPLGTGKRIAAGELVTIMPDRLVTRVGDTLRVVNHDVVDEWVGPFFVQKGKTFEVRFGSAGTYTATCALSSGKKLQLIVEA